MRGKHPGSTALMPKLDHVAARGIELANDRVQPGFGVAEAGRQLKQKTPHPLAKNFRNDPKIPNERLGSLERLDMRDEFADFNRIDELRVAGLTPPRLDVRDRRP